MTALSMVTIDQYFVNSLFQHNEFQLRLTQAIQSKSQSINLNYPQQRSRQVDSVIEEISELIKEASQKPERLHYQELKLELECLHSELDKVKDIMTFQLAKIQPQPRQLCQDFNMQDDQLFDLPSIKRTLNCLQEKVKEISVCSSTLSDVAETKDRQEVYHEKLSLAISQLEQSFKQHNLLFQETVNKRLQKQQKTINNILDTLNDFNGSPKTDKTAATLSNSRSATKLKSFFGFNT